MNDPREQPMHRTVEVPRQPGECFVIEVPPLLPDQVEHLRRLREWERESMRPGQVIIRLPPHNGRHYLPPEKW